MKKPQCHNCKHRGSYFKIGKMTHLCCGHPKWTKEGFEKGEFHPYDTLMEFWQTCEDHEYKYIQ